MELPPRLTRRLHRTLTFEPDLRLVIQNPAGEFDLRIGGQQLDRPGTVDQAAPRGAAQITSRSAITLSSDIGSITIGAFSGVVRGEVMQFPAAVIEELGAGTVYLVFYRPAQGDYFAEPSPALDGMADAANVLIGTMSTAIEGGGYVSPETPPGGWGGGDGYYRPRQSEVSME